MVVTEVPGRGPVATTIFTATTATDAPEAPGVYTTSVWLLQGVEFTHLATFTQPIDYRGTAGSRGPFVVAEQGTYWSIDEPGSAPRKLLSVDPQVNSQVVSDGGVVFTSCFVTAACELFYFPLTGGEPVRINGPLPDDVGFVPTTHRTAVYPGNR